MTDEAKARCSICKRPLDSPSDPTSLDCGGDCLRCMALIAEDPDCMTSYIKTQAREIERLNAILSEMNDTDAIARTMAENERLREALENIGNLSQNGCIKVDTPLGMYVGTPDAYAREIMGMPWRNAARGDSHDQ